MYNNEEAGPAFVEFLEMIGEKVRLKGFDKYRAGLDNKSKFGLLLFSNVQCSKIILCLMGVSFIL